jgi:hypothetical protein
VPPTPPWAAVDATPGVVELGVIAVAGELDVACAFPNAAFELWLVVELFVYRCSSSNQCRSRVNDVGCVTSKVKMAAEALL